MGDFFRKIKMFLLGFSPELEDKRPAPQIEYIRGEFLRECKPLIYDKILIVDDVLRHTERALQTLRDYFDFAELTVYTAHSFGQALDVYENHDIKLVILDCDLNDEDGDGEVLAREFLKKKPTMKILANSSQPNFNKRLLDAGAIQSIGKSSKRLLRWLTINCRC